MCHYHHHHWQNHSLLLPLSPEIKFSFNYQQHQSLSMLSLWLTFISYTYIFLAGIVLHFSFRVLLMSNTLSTTINSSFYVFTGESSIIYLLYIYWAFVQLWPYFYVSDLLVPLHSIVQNKCCHAAKRAIWKTFFTAKSFLAIFLGIHSWFLLRKLIKSLAQLVQVEVEGGKREI